MRRRRKRRKKKKGRRKKKEEKEEEEKRRRRRQKSTVHIKEAVSSPLYSLHLDHTRNIMCDSVPEKPPQSEW